MQLVNKYYRNLFLISDILGVESYVLASKIAEMKVNDTFQVSVYTIKLDGLLSFEGYTVYSITLLKNGEFIMKKLLLPTKPIRRRISLKS
ncbi:MAG: hypothetical protein QW416_00785 [Candidatus Nitrosocaldaceae archaeon]